MNQTARVSQQLYLIAQRPPGFLRCVAPERHTGQAQGGGKMGNAGIMPDELGAHFHFLRQLHQRQFLRGDGPTWRQNGGQSPALRALRFAADKEEFPVRFDCQKLEKFYPIRFGPVFLLATAAGMQREPIAFDTVHARGQGESRTRVGVANAEGLQRAQQLLGGVTVERPVRAVRAGDKLRVTAMGDVLLEYPFRVVKIRNNEVKLRKKFGCLAMPGGVADKETGQCRGFQGRRAVRQTAGNGKRGELRLAEDFNGAAREMAAQRRQDRQCQYEVAERSPANDQNFSHFLCLPDERANDNLGLPMSANRFSRRDFLKRSAAGSLLLAQADLLRASEPVKRTAVDQVTLGNTGIRLSRVGMGTGSDSGHIQRALGKEGFNSLVHYAYDQGITYLDCAQQYATFDWIGDSIRGLPREKLFIQSKINHQPEDILQEIDLHRKTFDTDYIDSLLIHCMTKKDWPESWKRIRDGYDHAKEKKWIRSKGVSCHSLPALRDAVESDWPEVHLVRVNPQGAFMDGPEQNYNMVKNETTPVLEQLKIMGAKGRGVIGMKMVGNGTFLNAEDRQKAVRFAMSLPEVHAVVIGFKSRAEVDEGLSRVNAALAEL